MAADTEVDFEKLLKQVKQVIGDRKITVDNVIEIVTQTMHVVEQVVGLNGAQKKGLVIRIIDRIVSDNLGDSALVDLIERLVPPAIDAIVVVVNSNLVKRVESKVCGKCCVVM